MRQCESLAERLLADLAEGLGLPAGFFAEVRVCQSRLCPVNTTLSYVVTAASSRMLGTCNLQPKGRLTALLRCVSDCTVMHAQHMRSAVYPKFSMSACVSIISQAASVPALEADQRCLQKHDISQPDAASTLRMLHYQDVTGQSFEPHYFRAAPHTDFDTVTLLFQRPGQGGLEVWQSRLLATSIQQCTSALSRRFSLQLQQDYFRAAPHTDFDTVTLLFLSPGQDGFEVR